MQPQPGSFEQSAESPFVVRLFHPVGRLIDRFGIVGTAAIKTAIVTVGSLVICLIVYHVIELDYWAYPVAIVMPVVAPILTAFPLTLTINWLIAGLLERDRLNLQQQAELRALAEEAARQKEAAEAASQAKSTLLANMSHELRTPLNAIIGFSDLFQSDLIDNLQRDQIRQYSQDINVSGRHLLGLVNDLLELARIEKGGRDFHAEPVHVGEKILEVCRIMRTQAEDAGVSLEIVDSATPVIAHTDDQAMRQILLNLVSNAIKFTPEGGRVVVEAEAGDKVVSVRISDTGIGIPENEIERVFEPFSQVDNNTTRQKTGTGLGLALVRTMVEQQNGTVTLRSRPGEGSTFEVRMPAGSYDVKQAAE